jgi:hypothetical protein
MQIVEQKPSDFIKAELQKFNVSDAAIAEMRENFLTIKVADFNDRENAALARSRRLEVKALRVDVEKTRKELKADALKFTQAIDGEARRITGLLEPIEAHLQQQEDVVAKYKARMEAEEKARAAAEQKAERLRLEAERVQIEEEKAKLERERLAIEKERADIEAAKQREIDLAAAAERGRIEAEERIKAEVVRKEQAERAAAAEAQRKEASKPAREKLLAFADQLTAMQMPVIEGDSAKRILDHVQGELKKLSVFIVAQASEM